MSDDWQVGDLALCVRGGRDVNPAGELTRAGCVYTVANVFISPFKGNLRLHFKELPAFIGNPIWASNADRFRKIRPHKADEQDRETIALLTGKPVGEPA